jgi:hypothetical protein
MTKSCIFTLNKICDNCGVCDTCDIDSNKTCSNCGKCLEKEVADYKQIDVDEVDDINEDVFEDEKEFNSVHSLNELSNNDYFNGEEGLDFQEDPNVDFIDDVDGLVELLEDPEKETLEEVFPGFFILKSSKKELH